MGLQEGPSRRDHGGCFYELGVFFAGVLILRALFFGPIVAALIFGNSPTACRYHLGIRQDVTVQEIHVSYSVYRWI